MTSTTNQQDRRERIAAQVLASIIATDKGYTLRVDVEHAIRAADELIAELDRTAPLPPSNQPEGWVIWDDVDEDGRPIRDRHYWRSQSVDPFASPEDAEAEMLSWGTKAKCRVRRWPLDPAEDKEVQS